MTALLSSTYFGPIEWYHKMVMHREAVIEAHDNYQKQTYRNRCVIATTQGTQVLTVPVERQAGNRVRISDHGNWRHLHWHALLSAYSESPFFDYYADDIRPFFEKRYTYLYDFNREICLRMCQLLDIRPHITESQRYLTAEECSTQGMADYRESIHPKRPVQEEGAPLKPYYQVFAHKHGFIPHLSILDLLFNMGPEAAVLLGETADTYRPESQ